MNNIKKSICISLISISFGLFKKLAFCLNFYKHWSYLEIIVNQIVNGMKILIQGIGGIGGIVASNLIANNLNITLITANPKITQNIKDEGIKYKMPKFDAFLSVKPKFVYTNLDEIPNGEKFDISIMLMKATHLQDAVNNSISILTENGFFVTCQNGIVEEEVVKTIDQMKIVSGVIAWGGTMIEPGTYEKTTPGNTFIGELNGELSERILLLKDIFDLVTPTVVSTNIMGVMWSKLAINSMITSIGAITGITLGEMLQEKEIRLFYLKTYSEIVNVANQYNIKLEKISSNPYLFYLDPKTGKIKQKIKDLMLILVGKKYGSSKSSSLQSLERGRKTEIEYLNGYVISKANERNISVPYNQKVYDLVKEIESGNRTIGLSNINELKIN